MSCRVVAAEEDLRVASCEEPVELRLAEGPDHSPVGPPDRRFAPDDLCEPIDVDRSELGGEGIWPRLCWKATVRKVGPACGRQGERPASEQVEDPQVTGFHGAPQLIDLLGEGVRQDGDPGVRLVVPLKQEDSVRVRSDELEEVEGVRDRARITIRRWPVDHVAEADQSLGSGVRPESLRCLERARPIAMGIPEDGGRPHRGGGDGLVRRADRDLRLQAIEQPVRRVRIERQDLVRLEELFGGHPCGRPYGPGFEGNAGGRNLRGPARTDPPFEPANALGNRVLSPASVAPTPIRAGLAELEHPRIDIVNCWR